MFFLERLNKLPFNNQFYHRVFAQPLITLNLLKFVALLFLLAFHSYGMMLSHILPLSPLLRCRNLSLVCSLMRFNPRRRLGGGKVKIKRKKERSLCFVPKLNTPSDEAFGNEFGPH